MIDTQTLEFYRNFLKDAVVSLCSCELEDEEWQGQHLVMDEDGVRIHFYPDSITRQTVVLRIEA